MFYNCQLSDTFCYLILLDCFLFLPSTGGECYLSLGRPEREDIKFWRDKGERGKGSQNLDILRGHGICITPLQFLA